jgi:tetratricopeptide (TPR) repeat protein
MTKRSVVLACAVAAVVAAGGAAGWRAWRAPEAAAEAAEEAPLPLPPLPPRIADGKEYNRCLDMVDADPEGAKDFAETWGAAGGGDGAEHCLALAEVELGDAEDGAARLERLGTESGAPAAARASVHGQAGQAWMMAGQPDRAYAEETRALALSPDEPDLLVSRAAAAMDLDRLDDADDDLTHALDFDPHRVDALVMRAAAARGLGHLDDADDDVERAFGLDPDNSEAHLERGVLRQRRGDRAGAREDWEAAMALAPDSDTADLAQQDLALLDAGPERR